MEEVIRPQYHLGLSATLACSALTAFISDLHYINHTAQSSSPTALLLAVYRFSLTASALPEWEGYLFTSCFLTVVANCFSDVGLLLTE